VAAGEAAPKIAILAAKVRCRPSRSPALPAGSSSGAKARVYASTIRSSADVSACRRAASVGIATLTIVVLTTAISMKATAPPSVSQRRAARESRSRPKERKNRQ
jgi:hypothetical protein